MPMNEHLPVKVVLIVEVDGHVLTFDENGKATGARYRGADPNPHGFVPLEDAVRGTVDTCAARAVRRANELVGRMFPVVAP